MGKAIPRRDNTDAVEQYAGAMLTLFKPWDSNKSMLLKDLSQSWGDAWDTFQHELPLRFQEIINNMQAVYECKDAAHDYAALRKSRLADLKLLAAERGINPDDCDFNDDPLWYTAMQTDPEFAAEEQALLCIDAATSGGFYDVSHFAPTLLQAHPSIQFAENGDAEAAELAMKDIMLEKERYQEERLNKMQVSPSAANIANTSIYEPHDPVQTTLLRESELAKQRILLQKGSLDAWNSLKPYQTLCLCLIEKWTLNYEQTLAFLQIADNHGKELEESRPPLRMMLGGPGGAGKSQVFAAITEFYECLNQIHQLKICAPTGLAANNVGGSTCHSEASLRVSRQNMHNDNPGGEKL
ncbi:hypothetical protein M422DRAFT_273398 [Sphaerobolus stellatus SS14]|uniref:DNA helicase n=1 Tax=Sphaerobolus stellatus (strain SS14) TaxID=990650 RepID=A0A0C9UJQ9_SPHS4|nr:hypothetical protein M422DRAFT_273398 [Sphaerobolus stellatus SS14]